MIESYWEEGCLCHSSHWVCEECCACLPIFLDHLHEQQHAAIVIVVTPLTAIMEEQVCPSISIAKVKNSIIIQVASLSSRELGGLLWQQ